MGSSGNRRRDGGQGLSIRTAQEMRLTEKAVDEDPPPPPSMQVFVPGPSNEDRYQVLVYGKEREAFIHRCYAKTRDEACRVMDPEQAHGHRVACRELSRLDRDSTRVRISQPPRKNLRVEALQSQRKALREAQGRVGIALPTSIEKLEAMLRGIVFRRRRAVLNGGLRRRRRTSALRRLSRGSSCQES
jgi:hypothetical protein